MELLLAYCWLRLFATLKRKTLWICSWTIPKLVLNWYEAACAKSHSDDIKPLNTLQLYLQGRLYFCPYTSWKLRNDRVEYWRNRTSKFGSSYNSHLCRIIRNIMKYFILKGCFNVVQPNYSSEQTFKPSGDRVWTWNNKRVNQLFK